MDKIKEAISITFEYLEKNKCLCKYNIIDIWNQSYRNNFESSDFPEESNDKLLCISLIRLTGEIYIDAASKSQYVCNNIQQLFEVFLSEDMWSVFIHHLKNSHDKYLVYNFIKAFSVVLYASSESKFSKRIQDLLCDIKEDIFKEININVLDFLSNIVSYNFKSCDTPYQAVACINVVLTKSISFADLLQSLCVSLSKYWETFMKQFCDITSRTRNQNVTQFLILWQKITERLQRSEQLHIFLNEKLVIKFLSNAYNMDVISLRIYVDIIMQYFISSLRIKSSEKNYDSLEESVVNAVNKEFFNLLSCDFQIEGFCTVTKSTMEESSADRSSQVISLQKCDTVVVKKVTFIFLSIITDLENKQSLSDVLSTALNFVKQNFDISSEEPIYRWILDVFIDQDDILFGIMLALLRIYMILKQDAIVNFPECVQLQNSLNPHSIFISFLQRIGFDHNELLAFLTSDETCFLLYILHYLKLLLKEPYAFIKTHNSMLKVDEEVFNCGIGSRETPEANSEPPNKKVLVSYSSSSSEEEYAPVAQGGTESDEVFLWSKLIAIKTLINLKHAIKKLVDANEFPYNVSPLILLLQACESNFL